MLGHAVCLVRLKLCVALHGKPVSELRSVTCHMESHIVTCHLTQVNAPALIPARQASLRFSPGGMEGWVHLGSLIAARPPIEPTTGWSEVQRPNRYATKPPSVCVCRAATARCILAGGGIALYPLLSRWFIYSLIYLSVCPPVHPDDDHSLLWSRQAFWCSSTIFFSCG